ncbi:MAG TPA: MFS transporter [Gemmataceae bacterium]|nr:MFS transporter [Gemmataceae bacterium]
MNLQPLLRSLAHRNYRLYFIGQGISLVGTWMQQIAMSWLVFQLTQSSLQLSIVLFAGQIPALFLAPVGGVLVDRWNRHRVLLVTQSLAMVQAFLLALLTWTGHIDVWQLILLSLFLGVVNTFDMTTRQAFLSELVTHRTDLANAIALNSSLVNGARLVGPTLAGIILAQTSADVCFLLNGLSYLAVLLALLAMRLKETRRERPTVSLWQGLREGFVYVSGFAPIRTLLLLLGLSSMAGTSYTVLLPEFTVRRLGGDARMLAFLTAASGLGALTGALLLASRKSVLGLGRWILQALMLLGVGLLAFAFVADFKLALLVLFAIGLGMMIEMAASNTLLQTIAAEDKRGRVMSFYTLAFLGMAPLGSLLTGVLSAALSPSTTLLINGLFCLTGAVFFALNLPRLRALVRPIYARLEILPPITNGIAAASDLENAMKE